jgi:uncharacterized membrane protein
MSEDISISVNVIAVTFEDDSNSHEGFTTLNELGSRHQIEIRGAALVTRDETGSIAEKDDVGGSRQLAGTVPGGLVDVLIAILGGPFGFLVGGATGRLIGSLFDDYDASETESGLAEISKEIRVGHDVVLAEVSEHSPEVIDTEMARLGATVLRRLASDIEAEIAAAEHAQREAKRRWLLQPATRSTPGASAKSSPS